MGEMGWALIDRDFSRYDGHHDIVRTMGQLSPGWGDCLFCCDPIYIYVLSPRGSSGKIGV